MDLHPHQRQETIELPISAGFSGTQVNFPDIPELRSDTDKDALVFAIQTYTAESLPNTFSGNALPSLAQLQNAFLTLYVLGTEMVFKIPLIDYLNVANFADGYYFSLVLNQYAPLRVDWTKSYIAFATPPSPETQFAFLLKISYEWYPAGTYATYLQNENKKWASGIIKV